MAANTAIFKYKYNYLRVMSNKEKSSYQSIDSVFNDSNVGKEVSLRGWVYRIRPQKNYTFLTLRDSSGIIQTVFATTPETEKLTLESSVELSGIVKKDARSPGGYELEGRILAPYHIAQDFPIKEHQSTELLNEWRHLWNRSRRMTNIMKIKAATLTYARDWLNKNEWYEVTPPIINKGACEGGSTLFKIDYFGEEANLSQSAQLYLESLIFSLDKVWSITPSFRAEKSKTPRHLAEFWHLEAEMAWGGFDDLISVKERLIEHICNQLAEKNYKEIEAVGGDPVHLKNIKAPFERWPHAKAIQFLNKKGFNLPPDGNFGTKEERELTIDLKQPIVIYGAPVSARPFYTKINPLDEKMVLSADIIAPRGFGELTTGGQREENLERIVERIKKEGFDPKNFEWYLDLRRYGSVPHSGFGLGIERILRWICNFEHIREAIPFPRTMNIVYP